MPVTSFMRLVTGGCVSSESNLLSVSEAMNEPFEMLSVSHHVWRSCGSLFVSWSLCVNTYQSTVGKQEHICVSE